MIQAGQLRILWGFLGSVLLGRAPVAGLLASLAVALVPLLASPVLSDFLWHEVMVMMWGITSVALLSVAGLVLLRRYAE